MPVIQDEPAPIPNDKVAIQDLVIQDIAERKQVGIERYGTPLQAYNGRDALVDLYQELLDATMYARQLIEECDISKEAASKWFASVVEAWQDQWQGTDHRYGLDFYSFVGERFVTDFDLRSQDRIREATRRG